MSKTIFEKVWDSHVVDEVGGWSILYIDRHLGHDGAARGLKILEGRGMTVRRPDKTLISVDHVIPTVNQLEPPADEDSRRMLEVVREKAAEYKFAGFFDVGDAGMGIAHVVSPEQGYTLPGITLVCGDSHTGDTHSHIPHRQST